MTFSTDAQAIKKRIELVKNIKVAICGELNHACKSLRDFGVVKIDKYGDAVDLSFALRKGEEYHLVLVYAPQGEGINADMPYKIRCEGEWKSVPIKLLNEPACDAAIVDLTATVYAIAKKIMCDAVENIG